MQALIGKRKLVFLYKADNWFWGGQNTDAFVCNCSWMQSMCMYLSAIQGVTKFKPNRNCCVNAISRCLIWSVFCFWLICNSAVSIEHFNSDTYMNILNCICIALHSKPMQTLQFHQLNLNVHQRDKITTKNCKMNNSCWMKTLIDIFIQCEMQSKQITGKKESFSLLLQ